MHAFCPACCARPAAATLTPQHIRHWVPASGTRLTPVAVYDLLSTASHTQAGKNINRAAEDAKDSAGDAYDNTKKAVR